MVDNTDTVFPFINITGELAKLAGKCDEGRRVRRAEGSYRECGEWYERLLALTGDSFVSPGGVSMFAPVSRAAVHKRLKEGRLTALCFQVLHREKTFFGTTRKAKARPYVFIPVSECKAWAKELQERFGDRVGDGTATPTAEKRRVGKVSNGKLEVLYSDENPGPGLGDMLPALLAGIVHLLGNV